MDKNEMIGGAALYGGGITTSCTAPAAYTSESTLLLVLSAIGALATVLGLAYTVWNGNRNYKLAQDELRWKRGEHGHAVTDKQELESA